MRLALRESRKSQEARALAKTDDSLTWQSAHQTLVRRAESRSSTLDLASGLNGSVRRAGWHQCYSALVVL